MPKLAKKIADPSSKPPRGRPRKAGQPVAPPPPAGPVELKPGEVEQSNCIAALSHARIRMAGQTCPHCGYPGEWSGLKTQQAIRHVVSERMEPARAMPIALRHIQAMLEMTAGKTANDTPTNDFCQICDQQNEHPGNMQCPCACHKAREFLNEHQAAYL